MINFLIIYFPGIAGAIIFLILLVLLVWMICVRATRPKKQEKVSRQKYYQIYINIDINASDYPQVGLGPGAEMAHGNAPNFYYGAPAPYAESIAPSHHRSVKFYSLDYWIIFEWL